MEKLRFKIDINAPKEKVWNVLWNTETYPQWTKAFGEGSRAISNWEEGSKVHFLDSENDGMFSIIEKKVNNEVMIFRHLGIILKGTEQPIDEQAKQWEEVRESYFLKEKDGITELTVETDATDEFKQFLNDAFPKALEDLKKLVVEQPVFAER